MSQLAQLLKEKADWQAEKAEMAQEIATLTSELSECRAERDKYSGAAAATTRRNLQQSSTCGIDEAQTMLAVCCEPGPPGPANGHRRVQASGCDSLPSTCSLQCASRFIPIFENCQGQPLLQDLSVETLSDWRSFHSECSEVEQAAAQMTLGPAVFSLTLPPIDLEGQALSATMFATSGSGRENAGPLDQLQTGTAAPPPPPEWSARSMADLMPTLLLPCNATYAIDLEFDVSPDEVRVDCERDTTIRGAVSMGKYVLYGGVNRAFHVTDMATLRLERIEISDRRFTHDWEPDVPADAIIKVEGVAKTIVHGAQVIGYACSGFAAVFLTDSRFARNPYRVLLVGEMGTAVVTRSVFIDNVVEATYVKGYTRGMGVNYDDAGQPSISITTDRQVHDTNQFVDGYFPEGFPPPLDSWWEVGMRAPFMGMFESDMQAGSGGVIAVPSGSSPSCRGWTPARRRGLIITDSVFTGNVLRFRNTVPALDCPDLKGGAIAVTMGQTELRISNTRFERNALEHRGCDAQLQGAGRAKLQAGPAIHISGAFGSTFVPSINISHSVFVDNVPSENGAVFWKDMLGEPCADYTDMSGQRQTDVEYYSESWCHSPGIWQAPGGGGCSHPTHQFRGQGGRDICHVCIYMCAGTCAPTVPGGGCPASCTSQRCASFGCSSSGCPLSSSMGCQPTYIGRRTNGCLSDTDRIRVSVKGRAVDNSPEPQDFGWWQSAPIEGRRLNAKADDDEFISGAHSAFAKMQAQIKLLMQYREEDRREIKEVKRRLDQYEANGAQPIPGIKKHKEARGNKTLFTEAVWLEENIALNRRVTLLEDSVIQLSKKTAMDIHKISVRLDQCEQDSFEHMMNRRQTQEQSPSACGIEAVQSMLAVCCSSGLAGNGHRRLQANGCDSLPPTCSLECSSQFISIFENCQGQPVLEQLPLGQLTRWTGFLGQCQEMQQSAAQLSVADAQPAMIFHCLVLDDAAQSQAEMFGQVTSPVLPVGPLQPIVTPPPPPASDGGAAQVQEFRRVCTRANLTVCAPPCNQASDGFLLSILIGGRGTMMTCNQEEGVFSWQGQSALGSCITRRAQTWLENIITHAAGTFALELAVSVVVLTAADLVAGQSAMLHGAVGGPPPVWTYSGEGSAFIVGAGAELEISAVTVAATSGLAFRIADSSTVMVTSLELQKGDGSSDAISCAALATGVGQAGLTCADTGFGSVNVAGPLFISTSGTGFGMGATKYMGDNRGVFEEAVSTREPGLYTCQISHDELVTLTLPVQSAMHVSIVGDDSMPQWSFTGEGPTFTVAVHAYLNLAYITVSGGQITLMRGGEVSLDHIQMQGTQLHVGGSLAASNSQLTDVQFETEAAAVMTMDSVTLSGTGEEALALPIGCSVSINDGEIRNTELQVTSDGELNLIGTTIYVEGMAVSVQTEGSFTVSSSQLIHGETTNPFPCNGANMACTGSHAGSVMVAGPASINTAAPLVCADESARSCLSGYVDMPSCLADIARGMESCFVYLQQDTGELGTMSVDYGEHFEIHGNQGEPKLRLLADFGVSGVLVLVDLQIAGGSGDASQMSVEAGGDLTLEGVEMEGGSVTFAGVVSVVGSSLIGLELIGSSGSELSVSGGTVARSTIGVTSGRMTIDGGCVLMESPVSVSGAGGALTISGAELQSDGSSVPLTIESGGAATVTVSTFRSMAGDITAVSVAEGGSLTVGGSQLVGADGSADPFPCDGTLPDCAGAHGGSVVVGGPSAVTLTSPLVCNVQTGECLADVCLARGDVCAEDSLDSMPTWLAGSTCVDAVCVCSPTANGLTPVVPWAAASDSTDLAICLADDVAAAVGTPCAVGCSPTITVTNPGELRLDCSKPGVGRESGVTATGLCQMLDRVDVPPSVAASLFLRGLLFDRLIGPRGGGAIRLWDGATVSVLRCAFRSNSAGIDYGGAIYAVESGITLTVAGCSFESNNGHMYGGAIYFAAANGLTITATTFTANILTAGNWGQAVDWNMHSPEYYTNDEANAAFGGAAGRRRLAATNESATGLPLKSDDMAEIRIKTLDSESVTAVDFTDSLQTKKFLGTGDGAACNPC